MNNNSMTLTDKPRLTVCAVIQHQQRYLIVKERLSLQGLVYNQPAGHVENGESLIEAIKREVLEETAYSFTPNGWLGLYRWRSPFTKNTQVRLCFTGEIGEHHAERKLDHPVEEALWLRREELVHCQSEHRSPLVLRVIDDAQRFQPIALERLVEPEMLF